jgi:hypothetical protein
MLSRSLILCILAWNSFTVNAFSKIKMKSNAYYGLALGHWGALEDYF